MDIRTHNLAMHFKDGTREVRLFEELSFEVPSGSSLAIMGQSGVGKTTLLYLLGGLEDPIAGDIIVGGNSYKDIRAQGNDGLSNFRSRNIGFVFQFHNLLPEFSALENVAMPLLIRGEDGVETFERAEALLARVGLRDRILHRPGALSGGEQQRVAVARALVGRPGVVLADEPTGNLDQQTGNEVKDLLLELQAEERTTLVLITHSPELAMSMNRVVKLTPQGMIEEKNS